MNINTSFSLSFSITSHYIMKDCYYINVKSQQKNIYIKVDGFFVTEKSLENLNRAIAQHNYDFSFYKQKSYEIFNSMYNTGRGDIVFYNKDFFQPTYLAKNAERFKSNNYFDDKDNEITINSVLNHYEKIPSQLQAYYKIGANESTYYYDENQEIIYRPVLINLESNLYKYEESEEFLNYIMSLYHPNYWEQETYRMLNSSEKTKTMKEYVMKDLSKGFIHKAIYQQEHYKKAYEILEKSGYDYKEYEKCYSESACYLMGKILLALEAPQFTHFIFNGGLNSFASNAPRSSSSSEIIALDGIIQSIIETIIRKDILEKELISNNIIKNKPKI